MMSRPMKNNDDDQPKHNTNNHQFIGFEGNNNGNNDIKPIDNFEMLERKSLCDDNVFETGVYKENPPDFASDYGSGEYQDSFNAHHRFIPSGNHASYNFPYQDMNRDYRSLTRMSCPTYHELIGDPNDINQLKNAWKKERNRLAAKKSRDKKAIHLKHLENKERMMDRTIEVLHEAVHDYDTIIHELLRFIENILNKNNNGSNEGLIMLFDCLCRLKKNTFDDNIYFRDVSGMMNARKLIVTNERVEDLTMRIRQYLNDILFKHPPE